MGHAALWRVKVQTNAAQHIFEAEVYLNDLDPNAVRVELYADGINGSSPVRARDDARSPIGGADSGYAYSAQVPATRPVTDYTARIIPHCAGVAVPLEVDPFSGSGESTSNGRRTTEDNL